MIIDSRYITPFFAPNMQGTESPQESEYAYKEGTILELKGAECDGFAMQPKRYRLVKYIDSINDVIVDAVIMKEIDDSDSQTIFSLTKADCENLNITFEPQLQIFPRGLNWQVVDSQNEENKVLAMFDPLDLSTYPVDFKTKRIKYMTIKISGCQETNYNIIFPTNHFVNKADLHRLHISLKDDIGVACDLENLFLPKGTIFPYEIATKKFSRCEPNKNFVDANGCLFIEFAFLNRHYQVIGVNPSLLQNKMFHDMFQVSIDSSSPSREMQLQGMIQAKYGTMINIKDGHWFIKYS